MAHTTPLNCFHFSSRGQKSENLLDIDLQVCLLKQLEFIQIIALDVDILCFLKINDFFASFST